MRKPEGKRQAGRRRRRWEDNKICLKEIGWETVDWVPSAQDRENGGLLQA
jgi:hypothetical protein